MKSGLDRVHHLGQILYQEMLDLSTEMMAVEILSYRPLPRLLLKLPGKYVRFEPVFR